MFWDLRQIIILTFFEDLGFRNEAPTTLYGENMEYIMTRSSNNPNARNRNIDTQKSAFTRVT